MISDPVPFLANIVLIAHSDGKLSPSELGQLEVIRTEHKIKKTDFNAAIRLVDQGSHKLTPIGTFADQVKNLELMLRVAYADDDLDKNEVSLIIDFCKQIGVSQNQLNRIKGEVLGNLKQCASLCPKCGNSADSKAKFCNQCGQSFNFENHDVQVKLKIPSSGFAIEFAESTAASFPKALEIAKKNSGFQSCKINKKAWYLAVYKAENISDAISLVSELSGIRNKRIYMDGQEKDWDEIFGFAWCASQRSSAYKAEEYCFGKGDNRLNSWGCMQARMDWTEWAKWFCFGQWEKTGLVGKKYLWKFDKKRIRHELANSLHRFRYCPHLSLKLYDAVIQCMPDTVDPESDLNWGYHEQYDESPGAIKIVRKQKEDGYVYTNEFWANGVRPKGLRGFELIMSKAFKEVGIKTSAKKLVT